MPERIRLGILATHPIQYYSALYRELANRDGVDLTVYFAHEPSSTEQGAGFGVPFHWDVDLLGGYRSRLLQNRSSPSVRGEFRGYDTPDIGGELRRNRFSAFLVMGWHALTYWQAIFGCWRRGIPLLVRGDSQLRADEPWVKSVAKRALYPHFIRRFAACLSVGQRSEEYFRRFGARTIIRSPHFVDNEAFGRDADAHAPHRAELRNRWHLPQDALVVLFAGKFVEKKRPGDLLAALARLRDRRVWGLFVGDGELRAGCEAVAAREGLRARFVGFLNQSEIASAYAAADVLALPSDARETWGLVVNEAMASGRPALVAETVGCTPDLIRAGDTGFAVQLGDVEAFTDRLARLEVDRAGTCAMGRAARAHIRGYSVQAAADGVRAAASLVSIRQR